MNNIVKIAVSVLAGLMLCLTISPALYADDLATGESSIVIDICVTGTTQVHVTASDSSHLDVGVQQGITDAHLHFAADADTVFDIYITGDGEADIGVSGPCEVNLRVEGSSEVHIHVNDEVNLNVEASDAAQVFVDEENLNEPLELDEQTSKLNSFLPIIAGVFLVIGLPAFLLVRRKAKKG